MLHNRESMANNSQVKLIMASNDISPNNESHHHWSIIHGHYDAFANDVNMQGS